MTPGREGHPKCGYTMDGVNARNIDAPWNREHGCDFGVWICAICEEQLEQIPDRYAYRCRPELHAEYYRGLRESRALAASVAVPVERRKA